MKKVGDHHPYLPGERDVRLVPADHPHMLSARRVSEEQSTDRIHPTGSVIVRAGKILGEGGNRGGTRTEPFLRLHKEGLCLRRMLGIKSGRLYNICPGCPSPAQHSEQVAIRDAKARNHDLHGADLYLWGHWWCCKSCWYEMTSAGIYEVYLVADAETRFKK